MITAWGIAGVLFYVAALVALILRARRKAGRARVEMSSLCCIVITAAILLAPKPVSVEVRCSGPESYYALCRASERL